MTSLSLKQWTNAQLCSLLGLPPASDDLASFVDEALALAPGAAVAQLRTLTGDGSQAAKAFLAEFEKRTAAAAQPKQAFKDNARVYRKKDAQDSYLISSKLPSKPHETVKSVVPVAVPQSPQPTAAASTKKPKQKNYVVTTIESIQAKDRVGNLVGPNGRLICECLAAKHGLLTNCLMCGKIVCQLEGPGPCPSCGSLVESAIQQVTMIQSRQNYHHGVAINTAAQQQKSSPKSSSKKQQQHVVNRYGQVAGASAATAVTQPSGPRDSDALFPTLASEKDLIALQKAEEQRERLLDYQRNSTARTRVFDTASDFDFQSDVQNKWLTAEERAIALKNLKEQERLEEERKKSRVISIDLQNRRVIHESSLPNSTGLPDRRQLSYEAAKSSSIFNSHDAQEQNVHSEDASAVVSSLTSEPGSTGLFLNPTVRIAPKYIPPTPPAKESSKSTATSTSSSKQAKPNKNQIQPWKAGEIDKENNNREKPATMKQMRELLAASGELQETEAIGHQFTAAMQAKKLAAKREAEARKYLKVERRRVQDDYDFESSSWNISSGVDGPGDEPACG